MILDSLLNKEIRLLKKVEKTYNRGAKLLKSDPAQAKTYIEESLKEIAKNHQIIKEKKKDFSILLGKIGDSLSALNNYKDADYAFKLAFSYDQNNSSAYVLYAKSLASRKDYTRAHAMVDKAININRKDKKAWEMKAEIYEKQGDVDEALKIYKNLINIYPDELKYLEKYLHYKPNDADILFKKGLLLYKKNDFDGSAKTLENVIAISSGNKEALLYLGAAYEKLERYGDAVSTFKKVIAMEPDNLHAWINLAVIYKKRGEYKDALKAIKEAIKVDPNKEKSWIMKAEIEFFLESHEDALQSINQALEIKETRNALLLKRDILKKHYIPEEMASTCRALIDSEHREVDIYLDLARAYYDMKKYEDALQVIDAILKASPHHLPTLILKKDTLKAIKRWEKVVEVAQSILDIDPKNLEAMEDAADAYANMGKYESSLHFMKRATEIDRKNVELWKLRKEYAKKLNKPAEVIDACVGIIAVTEDFDTYMDMGKAYYTLGRFDEAKKILVKALRIKDDAATWNQLGMVNYKLKDIEGAKNAFEKATALNPEVKSYWSNLGWVFEKLEKYDEAIEAIDHALELDSDDMRLWYQKGVCLKKLGELENALSCFDKALELNSEFTKALFEKGEILLELEHLDDAKEVYTKLLKLSPSNHKAMYRLASIYLSKKEFESCKKNIEDALKFSKDEKYLELKKDCCKSTRDNDCVIEVCREILNVNGRNLAAYRDLATAYMNAGKVDSAINTYRKGIEVFPENETLMHELKEILKRENRHADIIDIGKKILEISPEDFQTLLDIGRAYMALQHYDDAEDYLIRAMNVKKTKEVYDSLGELYMKMKDYRSALKYYADSLKIENDPENHYNMAKAHYYLGELDFATKEIRAAVRKKESAKYYLLGSLIYSDTGKIKDAMKYAQKALSIEDSPEIRVLLGKILINAGEYAEAIGVLKIPAKEGNMKTMVLLAGALEKEQRIDDALEMYRRILKEDNSNIEAYMGLGRINLSLEKYEEAKDAYEMAYRIDPHRRDICENLAFVYEKFGNLKESLRYLDMAIEMEPNNKFLWTKKGQILLAMEKYDEAKRAFEKALSIDGDLKSAREGLKDAERYIEERDIENYAREILKLEYTTKTKVTKKIAFKKLNIPLSILPKVFDYIRAPELLSMDSLIDEEKRKFEKATYTLAKKLNKIEGISLNEIIGTSKISVRSAKRLLRYIELCQGGSDDGAITQEDENLVRRAVDMDIKNLSILNLMLSLDIGICQAKRVKSLLKQLLDEDFDEENDAVSEPIQEEIAQKNDYSRSVEENEPENEEVDELPDNEKEDEGMFL